MPIAQARRWNGKELEIDDNMHQHVLLKPIDRSKAVRNVAHLYTRAGNTSSLYAPACLHA
jgi:hypothetical protein